MSKEQGKKSDDIFNEIIKNLDISEMQYNEATRRYQAVGNWLSDEKSKLALYEPEILPQGSFLLGTIIKPINDTDEIDVDLVCRLEGKHPDWTQYDLKRIVGDRLKENETYKNLLDIEGRRCWTLKYSDDSKFHMDILPSIVSKGYKTIISKAFSDFKYKDFEKTSIRITDNKEKNFYNETQIEKWHKSNPFGFASWFQERCSLLMKKSYFLNEAVNPLPNYQNEKLPLQMAVQILKRHRDIMFEKDKNKPISIIITTLAAKAYQKETDIYSAISNIINNMENFIEQRYSYVLSKNIKWVSNPVNEEENFADKWAESQIKEDNFYKWLKKVKSDLIMDFELFDMKVLQESLSPVLGKSLINKSFYNLNKSLIVSSTSILSANTFKDINAELPNKLPKPKREGFAR